MIQSVKVKNLSLSKENVRRRDRGSDLTSLAANIASQGLLQNLVVTPLKKAGHFTVNAGGRRLRALQLLIADGKLAADHEVPVLVLDDRAPSVEASLAENFHRVAMNPADECTAFKHFIDKGASAEDVAKRFGVTTRFVEGRVRLAELAPEVFEALAADEISLGVAQAYAVTADTDRQARVFEQMRHAYYRNQPDTIRRAILNGTVKAHDAKARFVGRDAYVAAGGRIEGDLFSAESDENWIDIDLLEDLASQKLAAAAHALSVEHGLAFVTPVSATHVPYDLERQLHEFHAPCRPLTEDEQLRIDALSAENDDLVTKLESELEDGTPEAGTANDRLDAIERELDAIDEARRAIDPAVQAQLGTFVFIGADGEARVHTRLFSETPMIDAAENAENVGVETNAGAAPARRLSAALVDELATRRRQILAAHVMAAPALALDLAIFLIAQRIVFPGYVRDHSTLRAAPAAFPILAFRDEGSAASQAIEEQRQALDTSWASGSTVSERFDAFRALDDAARGAWIAYAVAQSLEATLNLPDSGRFNGLHDHLGRLLDIPVASWWRPDAEGFFGRVKKDLMLDALEEIGGPILRGRYKDAKKSDLAATCASLCNGQGIVEAEVRERALDWLPDAMRFAGVEKPESGSRRSGIFADEVLEDDGGDEAPAPCSETEDPESSAGDELSEAA